MDVPQLRRNNEGVTLIELLIVLVIIAILAVIVEPSYSSFIQKQRVIAAQSDLVALGLNMENQFQQQLSYPTTNVPTTSTTGTIALFPGWSPAQSANFNFVISSSTSATYTLAASGITALVEDCRITLTSSNVRSLSGDCGGSSAWY